MFKLSKATGAQVVNNLDDLDARDLGFAELVEERKIETLPSSQLIDSQKHDRIQS